MSKCCDYFHTVFPRAYLAVSIWFILLFVMEEDEKSTLWGVVCVAKDCLVEKIAESDFITSLLKTKICVKSECSRQNVQHYYNTTLTINNPKNVILRTTRYRVDLH